MSEYRKELFDNLSDIVVVKKNGKIVDANKSFFKFFTNMKSLNHIEGKNLSICRFFKKEKGFIYSIDDDKWIEFVKKYPNHTHKAKIQRGNSTFIFKLEVINGNSTIIILKNISDIQTYEDTAMELTKMFEESEQRLEQYKKAIKRDSMVTIANQNEKITEVSRNLLDITGYTQKELIGKDHSILKDPTMPDIIYQDIVNTVKSKGTWHGVVKNIKKDRTSFYTTSSITPILDANQNITEYLSIRQDVTNLILSQNLAKKAMDDKYVFLSNMSLQLQTPLKEVKSIIKNLKSLNPNNENFIKIDRENNRVLDIIDDISNLSSYNKGEVKFKNSDIKLKDELNSLVNKFQDMAKSKNISLNINLDPDLPTNIVADFTKIDKVLSNLLANGIKFTNNGGAVYLNVEVMNNHSDGCNINFEVKDNGIGIKKENLEKIFEPFTQIKNPIIRNYRGTGLGLAISKEIVEILDSKLKIKSAEGEGSRFSFELNFTSNDNQTGVQKVTKEVITSQGKNRILVVDDNGVNRKLMEILLKKRGLDLELAVDGKEAYEKAIASKFDLVLMDIQMPVMGGIESMKKIKDYEEDNNIKPKTILISLSGNVSKEDSDIYLKEGFDACLTKPLREKELDIKLKRYLVASTKVETVEETIPVKPTTNRFELIAKELELDMDFLQDLLEMFFGDFHKEEERFAFAIETVDFDNIKHHAHKIKGSSLNLKLDAIAFVAEDLELRARNRELINYEKKFRKLLSVIDKIEKDFKRI